MTRLAYFDCFSGLAGDMALGALIDLGLDVDTLRAALATLPLDGWTLDCAETRKMGLRAIDVKIRVGGQTEGPAVPANPGEPHDHEHDHDHSHSHSHSHNHHHHGHGHDDAHAHGPPADHDPHDHQHHAHYHYADIVRILGGGRLPAAVVRRACAAFDALAEAEGRVHGVRKEAVHFHEVGAVDSILDIAGVAFGLWKLGIDRIESAPRRSAAASSAARMAACRCPRPPRSNCCAACSSNPAPCAASWSRPPAPRSSAPGPSASATSPRWWSKASAGARATPTSTTARTCCASCSVAPSPPRPPALSSKPTSTTSTPSFAGHLLDRLLHAGALDAWFAPVHMKKNRPGIIVGALADRGHAAAVEELLLAESSAIGLRRFPVTRHKLDRSVHKVGTPFGNVLIKIAYRGDQIVNIAPEYEACAAVARAAGVPLKTVYQHAIAAWLDRTPR